MTVTLEIPHVIVSELKAKGMGSTEIRNLFTKYVKYQTDLDVHEEGTLESFETYIDSNRNELEKDFPELKQEVVLEDYDN
jgi:hypothetical protein